MIKVIEGQALDEETPLVVAGQGPEPGGVSVPVYYRGGTAATAIAYEDTSDYNSSIPSTNVTTDKEPGEECAQCGCLFSWIPPVGVITCCIHSDAPPNSKRAMWAQMAFLIACGVFVVVVVYFMETYSVGEPEMS